MDQLDLLAVQGTLKSLLQHHSSKASILRRLIFFIVQFSHPYMTTGKDHDAGKIEGMGMEEGMTEDKIVGRHHRLNGQGFGWTPGVGDGQGGLLWFMG